MNNINPFQTFSFFTARRVLKYRHFPHLTTVSIPPQWTVKNRCTRYKGIGFVKNRCFCNGHRSITSRRRRQDISVSWGRGRTYPCGYTLQNVCMYVHAVFRRKMATASRCQSMSTCRLDSSRSLIALRGVGTKGNSSSNYVPTCYGQPPRLDFHKNRLNRNSN